MAQVNRATRNNVFGMLLPQGVIPAISGPVLGTNNFGTAWGSATGALVSWEPFDFGARRTNTEAAVAARARSEAAGKRTQFEVAAAAADAFLTLIAVQETETAAQAAVERAAVIRRTIGALVDAQLRPGADASRAEAELAAARTQLIRARQAIEEARASLAQFTGSEVRDRLSPGRLLNLPPQRDAAPPNFASNPLAAEQHASVEAEQARLRALGRLYLPRFFVQGAAYARGTGVETNGALLGGANGLAPNVPNYGLGLSVTFSPFELAGIRARQGAQLAAVRTEEARYQQIAVNLRARWRAAVAGYEGARSVASNTPVQLEAARSAERQASARYQSGLGNVTEVADAQRLVAQAEIDDALARLGVWRGLLGIAVAAGDLQPFLVEAGR